MAEKITKATNDKVARENAVTALGLEALTKVSNTEYALVTKNAEGNDTVVVVKLTVPKAQISTEEMAENYAEKTAETEARKAEKEAERAAKKAEKATKTSKVKAVATEDTEF